MNATELLAELRPPLDDSPADDARVLERILLAGPEQPRHPARRYRRPLAAAALATAFAAAGVALAPSGGDGPVGLERAVAALSEPEVLLHYKVTTTHLPNGATESAEAWQTPDGRRSRTIHPGGSETAYDQRRRVLETYAPERNEILAETDPEFFEDAPHPFGSIASGLGPPVAAGDLPALLTLALSGDDPKTRHVGRTTVRGIDVDHIQILRDLRITSVRRDDSGHAVPPPRDAPQKTITVVRDVYVRHDDALPVRVVDHLDDFGSAQNTTEVSDFTDVQKLTLDEAGHTLRLADHPGAKRIVHGPFDDSVAEKGR